jgi:LysM domain-containing protein
MEIREVVTKRLSNVMNTINSKRLLVLFGGSFLVFSLFYPPILTFSHIYMSMLVGYLSVKSGLPSLLDLILGYPVELPYFSLVYDFRFLLGHHYGLTILGINMVYGIMLAVSIYGLLRRIGKPASWKTFFGSSLLAAMTLYLVGSVVLLHRPTKIEKETSTAMKGYSVKAGDTCFAIASEYHTSVDRIIQINGLTSECVISVGHHLLLEVPAP